MMGALYFTIPKDAYLRNERFYISFQSVGLTTVSNARAGEVEISCVKLKGHA